MSVLVGGAIFFSCSYDKDSEIESTISDKFILKLKGFNNEYQSNLGYHPHGQVKCSDCWGGFMNFLAVAGSDIAGAGAGAAAVKEIAAGVGVATGGTGAAVIVGGAAVVAGAGASVVAYNALPKSSSRLPVKRFTKKLDIKFPVNYIEFNSIGAGHNECVYKMMNDKFDDGQEYYKSSEDFDKIQNTLAWQEVIEKINVVSLNYAQEDYNIEALVEKYKTTELITPNMEVVFRHFFEIYNRSENSHNIEDIVNFYIEAISSESTLSETEKQALLSSFSVASESPFFWANQN